MTAVIANANLKGGVGKTAFTVHLADALHVDNYSVLVIDLDEQGTAQEWSAVAAERGVDGPTVIGLKAKSLVRDLPKLSADRDIIIIDCPPKLGTETRAALAVADLAVFPIVPGPESLWAVGKTLDLLDEARALRPELKAVAVLNMVKAGTNIMSAAKNAFNAADIRLLPITIKHRVAYPMAVSKGLGVCSDVPGSPAAKDIQKLAKMLAEEVESVEE